MIIAPKKHLAAVAVTLLLISAAWSKNTVTTGYKLPQDASSTAKHLFEVSLDSGIFKVKNTNASWKTGQTFTQSKLDFNEISILDVQSEFGLSMILGESASPFTVSGTGINETLKGHFDTFLLTKRFKFGRILNDHVLLSGTLGIGRQSQSISYVSLPGKIVTHSDYYTHGYDAMVAVKAQYWWTNHGLVIHSHQVETGNEDGSSLFIKLAYLHFANGFSATDPNYLSKKIEFNQSGYTFDIGTSMSFDF